MKRLGVEIRLLSPLALTTRRPGGSPGYPPTYLAGARLRGALAEVLLASGACPAAHRGPQGNCTDDACAFRALFAGPTAARFLDALPLDATDLLPATAVTCSRWAGFRPRSGGGGPTAPAPPHGVYDTLLDRACWEILGPAGLLYAPRCAQAGCGLAVERYRGYYARRAFAGTQAYVATRAPAGLLARAAVDRGRRVAAPAGVHTVAVVHEAYRDGDAVQPTTFHGEIMLPEDERAAVVADLLPRIDSLGGGRSRGLGAVRVAVRELPAPEPLGDRLERFSRAWSLRKTQYARLAPLSAASLEGAYFSIDLRADTILRRDDWLPTTLLDVDLLRAATGVDDPTLTLVRAYAEPTIRAGWQTAWGRPRPVEAAVRRGSTYLFRTAALAPWLAPLQALEATGIGERTAEGYGEIRVCDPFHLVLRERAV
jgi:CRISPR-associated protein Csx10